MGVHFFVMQLISLVVFICCIVNVLNGFGAGPDHSVDVIILCSRPLEARRKYVCDCDKVEQELNRGMKDRLDKDDIGGSIDLGGGGEYSGERVPLDSEQGSLVQSQDLVRENGTFSIDEMRRRRNDGDRYRYGDASDGGVSSVVSTSVVSTSVVSTSVVPTGVVSTSVVPTGVVPTSVVPTGVVPIGVVSTSVVPTGVVPTSAIPTNTAPTSAIPTNTAPTSAIPTNTAPTSAVPTSIVTPTQSIIPTPTTLPTPTTPTYTLPTLHILSSPTQQHLLNKWLESFCHRQSLYSYNTPTVYYEVYRFAGLGNVFRGFFSAMTISVLTDRNVQGSSILFLPF